MKKKFLSLLFATTLAFQTLPTTLPTTTTAYADEPITIYVDNDRIDFTTTQPIIMNDRTMVPVRETAEILGFNVNWDPVQSTFGLVKGDLFVTHKIYSNAITVRSEVLNFDTTSIIIDDYSLLPIRMLQTALGADIAWDEATRSVRISTTVAPSDDNVGTTTDTSVGGNASTEVDQDKNVGGIISNFHDTIIASQNQLQQIDVTASLNTESIRLLDGSGNVVYQTSSYRETSSGRIFTVEFLQKYVTLSDIRFFIQAGVSNVYNTDGQVTLSVKVVPGAEIHSAVATVTSGTNFLVDSNVKFSVTGNSNATKAKIEDSSGNILAVQNSTISSSSSETHIFELEHTLTQAGTQTFHAFVGTDYGYLDEYEIITLEVGEDTSNNDSVDLQILDVYIEDDQIEYNDQVYIEVKTSSAADYMRLIDSGGNILDTEYSYSTSSTGTRTWYLRGRPTSEGEDNLYVYAYNDNDSDYVRQAVKVYVGADYWENYYDSYNTKYLTYHGCYPNFIDTYVTSLIRFDFTTSDTATHIEIYDGGGDLWYTLYEFSVSGAETYSWSKFLSLYVVDDEQLTYKVYYTDRSPLYGEVKLEVLN